MGLVTVTRAKQNAALANLTTSHLQNWIEAASDAIEGWCDRVFTSTAYTETQDGNGLHWLYVYNPPIISLTSVQIIDSSEDTETILADQFRYGGDAGEIVFKPTNSSSYSVFPEERRNIVVNYTGGYATIPDDIQEAVVQTIQEMYKVTNTKNPGLKQIRLGEYSETRAAASEVVAVTPSILSLIGRYRRVEV